MYQRLLIAVDGSETSTNGLEQALVLARSEDAEVLLLAVVPSYNGDLRFLGDKDALEAVRKPYEGALNRAGERAGEVGVKFFSTLAEGDPVEEILALAEQRKADCIALGKKGNYYSDLIPIGSVASKVARLAECDVLLTPNHKPLLLKRIVVPVDGSLPSRSAARTGTELALRYGAELLLMTVYEWPYEGFVQKPDLDTELRNKAEEILAPVVEAALRAGVRSVRPVVRHGTPVHREVLELVRQESADLVVMGSSGRGRFQRILLGSVAERIIGSGAAPVLLTRERKNVSPDAFSTQEKTRR